MARDATQRANDLDNLGGEVDALNMMREMQGRTPRSGSGQLSSVP
jgi:hypothetical protein